MDTVGKSGAGSVDGESGEAGGARAGPRDAAPPVVEPLQADAHGDRHMRQAHLRQGAIARPAHPAVAHALGDRALHAGPSAVARREAPGRLALAGELEGGVLLARAQRELARPGRRARAAGAHRAGPAVALREAHLEEGIVVARRRGPGEAGLAMGPGPRPPLPVDREAGEVEA